MQYCPTVKRRSLLAAGVALSVGACRRDAERSGGPVGSCELWMGGDLHLGAKGFAGLAGLREAIEGAAGIVNLEGPVVDEPGDDAPFDAVRPVVLANAAVRLPDLAAAGIRVAGIANNHALDRGADGLVATRAAVAAAGLLPAGGAAGTAILELGGRRVAVTAHDLSGGLPAELDAALADARAEADVLVSTFHTTGPPSYLPDDELRAAVGRALAAGASVVAAHGSHALGPVERRGDAVIAWGLGNLAFACDCTSEIDGAVLRVAVGEGRARATIFPIDAGLRGAAPKPSHDVALIVELLRALGSSPLTREGAGASF